MRLRLLAFAVAIFCASGGNAPGVILLDTGDPTANTSTPGDNSGWQYEGQWGSFLGTPIAPCYFLTAAHIGGNVGDTFTFHGQAYKTVAVFDDANTTDLRIWQVGASHPFPVYAPLYVDPKDGRGNDVRTEVGQELRVFGRGTQRGDPIMLNGTLRGWNWGATDSVERWGRNTVFATPDNSAAGYPDWLFLQANFDQDAPAGECHLSVGDSGGGVFILQDGLWRLAGINYGVDDLYARSADGTTYTDFVAAVFDARGYYEPDPTVSGQYDLITGASNVPTSFYSTLTAARNAWIQSVTGQDPATLVPETFNQWLAAYFSPSDLANSAVSGPNADPDGDGITNLAEYAYNLDPTFAEAPVMTAGTGLRGLPLVQVEQVDGGDRRVTVEFVQRTNVRLSYQVQFTTGTGSATQWKNRGTTVVTPINARWQRVKVTDSVTASADANSQYGRVLLIQLNARLTVLSAGSPTND